MLLCEGEWQIMINDSKLILQVLMNSLQSAGPEKSDSVFNLGC